MKKLLLAGCAVLCLAGQATIAQAQPASPAMAATAAKSLKVGDRVPAAFLNRKFRVADPSVHKLSACAADEQWLLINGTAFLIDTRTDRVKVIVPVTPQ